MSDQVLGCIDGTQDVCHLDLKGGDGSRGNRQHARWDRTSERRVSAHRQVAGRPLQLLDALAQGAL